MCRHLAYVGPSTAVGELLTRGPHSLRTQSWAPREMRGGGTINADGFGVAWWLPAESTTADHGPGVTWHGGASPDPRDTAVDYAAAVSRYRNAAPIWTDPAVDEVLPQLRSTAVLAAIRSATVGMPVEREACAPFTHGHWAFSHNGAIPDWRNTLTAVAARFGSPSLLEAESLTDSAVLWVILRDLLTRTEGTGRYGARAASTGTGTETGGSAVSFGAGVSVTATSGAVPRISSWSWHSETDTERSGSAPVSATGVAGASSGAAGGDAGTGRNKGDGPGIVLREVVREIVTRSPKARLNFLLGDGETVWATTWHHSLSVLVTDEFAVVASEPYDDDPRWRPIADRHLVVVRPGSLIVESLETDDERAGS